MKAIKLNNDRKINQIEINHETIFKQYSRAEIRILPRPSAKNIRRKRVLFKICKSEASKPSVPYYVEQDQLQTKNFKKSRKKKQNYKLKSINFNSIESEQMKLNVLGEC